MSQITPDDAAVLAAAKAEIENDTTAAAAAAAAVPLRRPAAAIIHDFLRDAFDPIFRRYENLWSRSRGRLVRRAEILGGAPTTLIEMLGAAIEARRNEDGTAQRSCLPKLYREWAPTALADLLAALPEEEGSAEVEESAGLVFRRQVASAFFTQVTLAKDEENREIQIRRSLIDWCFAFAKPGPWQSVRSYLCWVRGSGIDVRVAIRAELFGQLGPRELADMTQNKFGRLSVTYGVGEPDRRVCGRRVVELTPQFIAELRLAPDVEPPSGEEET